MSQAKIQVTSDLKKLVQELDLLAASARKIDEALGKLGPEVEDKNRRSLSSVERFLTNTRQLGGRMIDQLKRDLKSLAGINAVGASLKLSNQFAGSVRDTLGLSDAIRKLGGTFGVASNHFASFQNKLTRGLGDIGLSSQVATDALAALADTPVRGEEALISYSKTAGQLASISRETGQEGTIAKGIANVITARGGNPNDVKQVSQVAEDLRRAFNQTGKGPAELLAGMQQIFEKAPQDIRRGISTRGLVNLAAAGQVAGPGSGKFIEELLGKSPIARMALNAQGFGNVFGNNGLNVEQFRKASQAILGRIGFDPQAAAKTLGISDEAAQGFVRLAESLDKVKTAQDGIAKQTGSITEQYKKNLGFGEAFRANINKVKGLLGVGGLAQGATDILSGAAGANGAKGYLESGAIVAGGGLLAALLAGAGLKGVGGGLLGGIAKGAIAGEVTGKDVQPVYVVNAGEIGLGGALGAGAGGGLLKKAGGAALGLVGSPIALGGAAIAAGIYEAKTGGISDAIVAALQKAGIGASPQAVGLRPEIAQKMHIELNKRELRETKPLTKGAVY